MEKQYMTPTLEKTEWKLNDVILYSVPQVTEPYEVIIKRKMVNDLADTGALPPEEPDPTEPI